MTITLHPVQAKGRPVTTPGPIGDMARIYGMWQISTALKISPKSLTSWAKGTKPIPNKHIKRLNDMLEHHGFPCIHLGVIE